MDKKRKYIAPEVSVDKYEAEEGYAGSLKLLLDQTLISGLDEQEQIEHWAYDQSDNTFGTVDWN